jgi:hypothetical protein
MGGGEPLRHLSCFAAFAIKGIKEKELIGWVGGGIKP